MNFPLVSERKLPLLRQMGNYNLRVSELFGCFQQGLARVTSPTCARDETWVQFILIPQLPLSLWHTASHTWETRMALKLTEYFYQLLFLYFWRQISTEDLTCSIFPTWAGSPILRQPGGPLPLGACFCPELLTSRMHSRNPSVFPEAGTTGMCHSAHPTVHLSLRVTLRGLCSRYHSPWAFRGAVGGAVVHPLLQKSTKDIRKVMSWLALKWI